ncbi:MAG TPA: hypothetical protein DEO94_04135 [Cyanobacteria bacterium UBA11991]|nr:hypothetical protein [Cyanobacteriota bacterium]MDY6359291.1 hypothetical protein [Cyanobacteriota bacterium]MDY6364825.1 hypothetical protein [Cyanobacteriota bacterium]MDY6382801.1 hypothetical protein [Cyanobacteriota bacterium]HCB11324.1 hypothetical protein [Cyanobacteria bacterium UBA11991]
MNDKILNFEEFDLYHHINEEISESITQNWTTQALECYYLNGNCKNCSITKGHYSFICQMPRVIDTLLKTIGAPDEEEKTA